MFGLAEGLRVVKTSIPVGVASRTWILFVRVETGVQFFHPGFGTSRPQPAVRKIPGA
jgi:hypothetical protein